MADASLEVGKATPVSGIVQDILNAASSSISRLLILCHGYESTSTGNSSIPMALGFGLQFGMESLTLKNIGVLAPLYGAVQDIILYACGPANTDAAARGTYGDGQQFCREMAACTNANVYASDVSQEYNNLRYDNSQMICETIPIDFGQWEGHVYRFSPDGSMLMVQ